VGNKTRLALSASIAGLLSVLAIVSFLFWTSASPASPDRQFSLIVVNIDGPPVDVAINGEVVAHLVCHGDPIPGMTPSARRPLPWTVTVTRSDGTVLGTWIEAGDNGDRKIDIRADYVVEVAANQGGGGMPGPCAT
jgi:hypothetical protein